MITEFLNELRADNSRNYKLEILKKYDSKEVQTFLKLVYDNTIYNYGIKMTNVVISGTGSKSPSIYEIKSEILDPLCDRKLTGNNALNTLTNYFNSVNEDTQEILRCIINRDLESGINSKSINKIFKGLIFELPYMRCSLMDKVDNIKFPAIMQTKMDGTYRTFIKRGSDIESFSRSGEKYEYPRLYPEFEGFPDGAYIGELIVNGLEGDAKDIRYKSNGLLNSLEGSNQDVSFYAWDYLTLDEFKSKSSDKKYIDRFNNIVINQEKSPNIKKVFSIKVANLKDALDLTRDMIGAGEEGTVLKDLDMPFKDGTSKFQIKLKQSFEVDMRVSGFIEGKGRLKNSLGSIEFVSDDGKFEGQVSGFTDAEREEIWNNQSKYQNTIIAIEASDITESKNKDKMALLFPRFKSFRTDKTYTDDYERIKNMLGTRENLDPKE